MPQLGSNAGAGAGYLVVEGDESDRTVFALPAEIAVVTNVELDHHTEFASLAELEAAFDAWLAAARAVVRDAPPYDGTLALPGEHNRLQRGHGARRARGAPASPRAEAAPALARFTGTGRRFEVHRLGDFTIVDDYAHHPTEIAATIAAARERFPGARLRVLFQPHLYSRTRHLAGELADGARRRRRRDGHRRLSRARGSRSPASPASSSSTRSRDRGVLAGVDADGRGRARRACAAARSRATCCSCSAPATSTGPSACSRG